MKNKKNLLLVAVTVASLSSALSSCKKNGDVAIEFKDNTQIKDGTVRLLNFKPEIASKWETIASEFKKDTGITLAVESAAEGKYESTLRTKISTDAAPTIFQINGPVGYGNWSDYCANLTNLPVYSKLKDKSLAVMADGAPRGIPQTVEGYGIIYNKAITDKYFALESKQLPDGVTKMEDINSYVKLKAVVEDMQKNKTALDINGVFAPSGLDDSTSWRISGHAFNMPLVGEFGNATSMPKELKFTKNKEYRNLIDLYVKNSTTTPANMVSSTMGAESAAFASEQVAMIQNGQWATNDLTGEGAKAKAENLRYLPLYCGLDTDLVKEETQGLCVGTEAFWAINKQASEDDQSRASIFMTWLFDGNGKKYAVSDLGFSAAPYVGFNSSEFASTDALAVQVNKWLNDTTKKSVPWDFPLVPNTDNQRAPLVAKLKDYYNSNLADDKWNALVSDCQSVWTSLVKQIEAGA